MKRLAFVVPRYGENVLGGAETLAREMAQHLVAAGIAQVEVFTTCATSHLTWQNDLPATSSVEQGVVVHRFPVASRQGTLQNPTNLAMRLIQYDALTRDEQLDWVAQSVHSPELYAALDQRIAQFDLVFLIPYLFGTTFYASTLCPERTIIWPCLHDEVYAQLDITRELLLTARGILFNSNAEAALAKRLYGFSHPMAQTVGVGFDPLPEIDQSRFRRKYGITQPFMLYSGRLESPKNVDLLIDYFCRYSERNHQDSPFKLVLMGEGPVYVPDQPEIIKIGFQTTQHEKYEAFSSATVLCQPSTNESFSIVMMEAWQHGKPVLVNQYCDVTREHVTQINGGLCFADYAEFEAMLDVFAANDQLCNQLGRNGQRYVQQNYTWSAVLKRFENALQLWS